MDRGPATRKRRVDAPQPTSKPPIRITRDKRQQPQSVGTRPQQIGRIKEAKDSSEFIRVPKKVDTPPRPANPPPESNVRPFMVANVEANGAIYLKPRRLAQPASAHSFLKAPATPPRSADGLETTRGRGEAGGAASEWPLFRSSDTSGNWTPRPPLVRAITDETLPTRAPNLPPLSMANVSHHRRRTRSASFSTTADSVRPGTFDSNDFQILLNGREARQPRPKSSVDLGEGLLDFPIPHYRLGTPRFSERGTAYLTYSMYSSMATSEDMRSSVFSRAEYDRLFPAPPGRNNAAPRWHSGRGPPLTGTPYLHPSSAASLTLSGAPPMPPMPGTSGMTTGPAMYDRIEANVNDPSIVRYSPTTGRIVAATIGRLISQITSPLFLDYELLADFFLAYRNFLSAGDLLDYLFARMKWALNNENDAGRIVRVRTFVALRHWILNYFQDDFVPDISLRQRFCEQVNELAHSLRKRHDGGGSDINVIGELKKCWRRTCAALWPIPDGMELSPDVDVHAGGSRAPSTAFGASATSLPLTVKVNGSPRLDFRRTSQIELLVHRDNGQRFAARPGSMDTGHYHTRTASIPTSPLSVDSLEVLSCSVPFLRYIKPHKDKPNRPAHPPRSNPQQSLKPRSPQTHKRSVSFSDALRDDRAPLSSGRPESVDLSTLRSHAFTGGLVRGLLLQPSPSTVDLLVPITSTALVTEEEARPTTSAEHLYLSPDPHFPYQQNASVKRIVGDVRRVLSSKRRDSPNSSHRSTNSSDSHTSAPVVPPAAPATQNANMWQQLRGPQKRVDLLGKRLEISYQEVFHDNFEGGGSTAVATTTQARDSEIGPTDLLAPFKFPGEKRLDSHLTTGSRSIVIVDDTVATELAGNVAALSPMVVNNKLFLKPTLPRSKSPNEEIELHNYPSRTEDSRANGLTLSPPSDQNLHDSLAVSDSWNTRGSDVDSHLHPARKSSNVHPDQGIDMAPIRNQLRRRPGGDLKAAENVQDLESAAQPKRGTDGSGTSTFTQEFAGSGSATNELSGTHFSGENGFGFRLPASFLQDLKQTSLRARTHSSQPDLRPEFSHLRGLSNGSHHIGGIEDALARLEGKESPTPPMVEDDGLVSRLSRQKPRSAPLRLGNVADEADVGLVSPRTDRQGASIYHMSEGSGFDPDLLVAPAVARDTPDQTTPRPVQTSVFPMQENAHDGDVLHGGHESSPRAPDSAGLSQASFLLDDNESLSDISTDIAEQSGDDSLGVRSFFFDDTADDMYTVLPPFQSPPTPPSTIEPRPSPEPFSTSRIDATRPLKEVQSAPKLLGSRHPNPDWHHQPSSHLKRTISSPLDEDPDIKPTHLPFILAFDAEVLAEQFTIIEKDALDEVSWRDLIALDWRQQPSKIRNWVDYLHSAEFSNGIDIVTTRFNLTVKWIVSECVLTDSLQERAQCLIHYIHIAELCHRRRNYATTYQITLALLSADLARLHKTWSLVPAAEKRTLARLESLCLPSRNFHTLRAEMEAGCANAAGEEACIPFIGLYTHDLMFNAQKPARLEPPPPIPGMNKISSSAGRRVPLGKNHLGGGGGDAVPQMEALVNFERYQTAATIVKSLLRLIEASAKYVFRPHPEVLSRCLWLAALDDAEISARSRGLE